MLTTHFVVLGKSYCEYLSHPSVWPHCSMISPFTPNLLTFDNILSVNVNFYKKLYIVTDWGYFFVILGESHQTPLQSHSILRLKVLGEKCYSVYNKLLSLWAFLLIRQMLNMKMCLSLHRKRSIGLFQLWARGCPLHQWSDHSGRMVKPNWTASKYTARNLQQSCWRRA